MSSGSELSITSPPSYNSLPSQAQRASLVPIVKAQIGLLLPNLKYENYARNALEIRSLLEKFGNEIREHLYRRILVEIFKQPLQDKKRTQPYLLRLLKETGTFATKENTIPFAHSLQQFCQQDATTRVDLELLFETLKFDAFDQFVFSASLLIVTDIQEAITFQE
ncbi:hypothetical protein BDA99DRAFT_353196 [Phascolomyces articulosus]|uniref:Uncharacterized protein n=1 Tax=Phascolomyces articulosus TaxID=60185 RepID=A0AAD5K3E3_9FUNG|nr:hypothetical protein BDA99DRAFT_353196 [Phascolomyces articulosus]